MNKKLPLSNNADPNFEICLPQGRETFRTWEVAKILGHSRKHVENLIDVGAFGPVVDCAGPKAKKSSLIISRSGLLKFLRERKR